MKKIISLSLLLILSACSKQYDVHESVRLYVLSSLEKHNIQISNIEVFIKDDKAEIFVKNSDGINTSNRFILPQPNEYFGTYIIEYSCVEEECSLTYDEKAAEILNDEMIKSFFDVHVAREIRGLKRKVKMLSN